MFNGGGYQPTKRIHQVWQGVLLFQFISGREKPNLWPLFLKNGCWFGFQPKSGQSGCGSEDPIDFLCLCQDSSLDNIFLFQAVDDHPLTSWDNKSPPLWTCSYIMKNLPIIWQVHPSLSPHDDIWWSMGKFFYSILLHNDYITSLTRMKTVVTSTDQYSPITIMIVQLMNPANLMNLAITRDEPHGGCSV